MKELRNSNHYPFILGLIILGIMTRFLPHPPNFTAVGAVGLFGAAYIKKKWLAVAIPLICLWISDLVLNNVVFAIYYDNFSLFGNIWVYLGFIATGLIGVSLLKKIRTKNIFLSVILSSIAFYLISNFGVWIGSAGLYPKTFLGLIMCYVAGLEFFLNSFLGNAFFAVVMFGSYEWILKPKYLAE